MIHIRHGKVVSVRKRRPGLLEVECDTTSGRRKALAYEQLTGPVREGDSVVLNASAVELRLGTGGWDFVIAVEGAPDRDPAATGRGVKMRYTPTQVLVDLVEEQHAAELDAFEGLRDAPVVLCGLHSALPAVAIGARSVRPNLVVAYVMTDAAALPLALSDTVAAMRSTRLLDVTITCGQAFGGDYEAVNVYSGIAAARSVADADLVLCGMGPGNLGTGSRLGFALIEQGALVNAVAALGGTPVVVPRLSFSDARERHYGISHHTVTALTAIATARAVVTLPPLEPEKKSALNESIRALAGAHDVVTVQLGAAEAALRASPLALRTMGRSFDDDPEPFRAAAAAGTFAARMLP
jgi:hypothetical protein